MLRALAIAILIPALAGAQRGTGIMGRGRGAKMIIDPGIDVPPPVNIVNLIVEHRPDLALSDSQFARVITVKRALDLSNSPYFRRIDSVQRLFKRAPVFSDPTPERRDSLNSAHALVREMLADIEQNIADGREKALAFLSPAQGAKAEQIEDKARKAGAPTGRGRL